MQITFIPKKEFWKLLLVIYVEVKGVCDEYTKTYASIQAANFNCSRENSRLHVYFDTVHNGPTFHKVIG